MAKIANKQVICDVLVEEGKKDKDIDTLALVYVGKPRD